MPRTIISLTDEQADRLRRTAQARNVSMAAVIRDVIDRIPDEPASDRALVVRRALSVSGKYRSGVRDLSANHDDYAVEAYVD